MFVVLPLGSYRPSNTADFYGTIDLSNKKWRFHVNLEENHLFNLI